MIEIGQIRAEAGTKQNGWLEIAGEDLKLPLTLISGRKEGKTLLISAGIHGAEYIGVQTLLEISGEIDPDTLSGNVICLHMANPSAFKDYVRFYVPEDGKNLNRVFPGKKGRDAFGADRMDDHGRAAGKGGFLYRSSCGRHE